MKSFLEAAQKAKEVAEHDDDCPSRKGKECSCRSVLAQLARGDLKELESKPMRWRDGDLVRDCVLVRVDDGREIQKVVPDPVSQTARPITIVVTEPPRWVCTSCAASLRGNDHDHHCDPAVKARALSSRAMAADLPVGQKFGGAYGLMLWRDEAGEYNLDEVLLVDGLVKQRERIAGPESYNVIEGAILDAGVTKLTP